MESGNNQDDYRLSHLEKGEDYDAAINAGDFNSYMAENENKLLLKELPLLYPAGIPSYLDFACGTGRITSIVEKLAKKSTGVDVSEKMLAEAEKKCTRSQFIKGDIVENEIKLPQTDLVTAFRFFGNAEDHLRHAVLSKLNQSISEGGYLVINNHRNPYSLHELLLRLKGERPETDLSYWKLKTLLQTHGFRVIKVIGIAIWACTYSLKMPPRLNNTKFRMLEPLSRIPLVGPYCPDMIVIAQKIQEKKTGIKG